MFEGDESNFDAAPPEESNNRTFMIAAGILIGVIVLVVACLGGFLVVRNSGQKQSAAATNAEATRVAEQINAALTSTFQAMIIPTQTIPSPTSVLAPPSETPTPTSTFTPDPSTATVAAALTQAAIAQLTIVPTSTALPGTGIADEYGLPGLAVMALAFMIVILLARRLRAAPVPDR